MIIDLHQDISVKLLSEGIDSFLNSPWEKNNTVLPTYGSYGLVDQSNYHSLIDSDYKIVLGASCALPLTDQGVVIPRNPKNELLKHLEIYHQLIKSAKGKIRLVKNKQDLSSLKASELGIILSIEGLYCIEKKEDLATIDIVSKLGVKVIGPFWNLDNALGGGAKNNTGLTVLGKETITYIENKGIIIDGAHSNPAVLDDILAITSKPIIISHTLSNSVHSHFRNVTDKHIKAIHKRGGIIGICFIRDFNGTDRIQEIIQHISHIAKMGSMDTIAIGSDYSAMLPSDVIENLETAPKISALHKALLQNGFTKKDIEKILWKNAYTFFQKYI